MNHLTKTAVFIGTLYLVIGVQAQAGELTQNFVNPDFGGNPLNGGYLLSNASAQNDYSAPVKSTTSSTGSSSAGGASSASNTAQQFAEQVNRLVMSALASKLVNKAFGADSGNSSDNTTINTGINTISVETTLSGTSVTIVDNASGNRSVISIPNY